MTLAVTTAALTIDGIDPAVLRYVVVLLAGLALGGVTVWALCARELREHRDAARRLGDILEAAREARQGRSRDRGGA